MHHSASGCHRSPGGSMPPYRRGEEPPASATGASLSCVTRDGAEDAKDGHGASRQSPAVAPSAAARPAGAVASHQAQPAAEHSAPAPLPSLRKGRATRAGAMQEAVLGVPKMLPATARRCPPLPPHALQIHLLPFPNLRSPPQLPAPFLLDLLTASNCRPGPRTSLDAPAASAHIFTGQGDTTSLRPRFGTAPLAPLHASPPSPQLFLHEPVAAIKYSWPCVVNKHYKFMTC